MVFTSLYHHICDVDNLRACYDALEAKKATGVDGVSKEGYGRNIEENLQGLSERLRRMGYRPGPISTYIPSGHLPFRQHILSKGIRPWFPETSSALHKLSEYVKE